MGSSDPNSTAIYGNDELWENGMRLYKSGRSVTLVGLSSVLAAFAVTAWAANAGADTQLQIKESHYGFSFALPASWKLVPLNGSDVTNLLNTATHDDPSLANGLSSQVKAGASKGMKVFAIGPLVGSTIPNVNVIVASSAGGPTGRAFAQSSATQAKIEMAELGVQQIKTSVVQTRLGAVAEAAYTLNLKNTAPQFGVQLYLEHASRIDIVTVTTSNAENTQSNLLTVISSWRWK
jgi:hypothetical protein